MRGFFGIGIEAGKTPENLGGLWRSAQAFGASFIFTIGCRYPRRQPMDTTDAMRNVPLTEHETVETFLTSIPRGADLIGVDCGRQIVTHPLPGFHHPRAAVYVLGAEDRGLSTGMLDACLERGRVVEIPTSYCLNVATTGALVMYDRLCKAGA